MGWRLRENEVRALDGVAAGLDRKMVQNIFQTK
jgi:hypothetical protein